MRRLGEILDRARSTPRLGRARRSPGSAADSRKVDAGRRVLRARRRQGRRPELCRRRRSPRARASIVAERAPAVAAPGVRASRRRARGARAAPRARFYPRQPRDHRRRHRHQRQDLGRRLRRGNLGALGHRGGLARHASASSRVRSTVYGSLTTPDPIALHQTLDRLAGAGVTHLALEASSHGLDQKRLDGVRLAAGAFTNLSRDHLDYHATMEDYLAAKLRLFRELLPPGAPRRDRRRQRRRRAVSQAARARGPAAVHCRRARATRSGSSTRAAKASRRGSTSTMPANVSRAFAAAGRFPGLQRARRGGPGIATAAAMPAAVFAALETLEGAPGRLERVGARRGAPVFVDYAHKPDALEKALARAAPVRHAAASSSCSAAAATATPASGRSWARSRRGRRRRRSSPTTIRARENPATIRAAILAAAPGAREIGDRAEAIRAGVADAESRATRWSSPAKAMKPAKSSATARCRFPTPIARAGGAGELA